MFKLSLADIETSIIEHVKWRGRRQERSVNYMELSPALHLDLIAPISWDTNDNITTVRGYLTRLLRDVPIPDTKCVRRFKTFVRKWVRTNLPRNIQTYDFESWLERTGYNECRKEQLRKVYDDTKGVRPTLSKARRIS